MAEIRHLENRHDVIFFCRRWSDLDKISETGAEWHVNASDVVEIEVRCRIPIGLWRTFGEFNGMSSERHVSHCRVLPLWWIHSHDSRDTCHVAGFSHLAKSMSWTYHIAGCKNSIRHIENRFSLFLFLMQFRLWRAAAFVSSPIHLLLAQSTGISHKQCLDGRHCACPIKAAAWCRDAEAGGYLSGRLREPALPTDIIRGTKMWERLEICCVNLTLSSTQLCAHFSCEGASQCTAVVNSRAVLNSGSIGGRSLNSKRLLGITIPSQYRRFG